MTVGYSNVSLPDRIEKQKYAKLTGWQWTTTLANATLCGLLLALLVGFVAPWLWAVLERLLLWADFCHRRRTRRLQQPPTADFQRDGNNPGFWNGKWSKATDTRWPTKVSFGITAAVVLLPIFFTIAGIFSARGSAYSTGLIASGNCGLWTLSSGASDAEQDAEDLAFQAPKERRAGIYQRACYQKSKIQSPELCSFFAHDKIPYHKVTGEKCPFSEDSMCAAGPLSAVTFMTGDKGGDGLVSADGIGLNVARAPKFRRKVTCSPITTKGKFVSDVEVESKCSRFGCQDDQYWYNYGYTRRTEGDGKALQHTFMLPGDPFNWHTPAYNVW
jgi:hypothetical protein